MFEEKSMADTRFVSYIKKYHYEEGTQSPLNSGDAYEIPEVSNYIAKGYHVVQIDTAINKQDVESKRLPPNKIAYEIIAVTTVVLSK